MPLFQFSYWPQNVAGWVGFGRPVEAESARAALETRDPQAVGRYRVAEVGAEGPGTLFRLEPIPGGVQLIEVDGF